MKKYIIFISFFALFCSNALAEVATVSDSCATITLDGPDSIPQTSYYIKASAKNNSGIGYSALFYVDDQLKDRKADRANATFSGSFGPFEGKHTYKLSFENLDRANYCKRTVELSIKKLDPKEMAAAISSSISTLANSAFKGNATQLKNAFTSKIDEVISLISLAEAAASDSEKDAYYQQAIDKLEHDILAKMDGSSGGQSKNDWIIDQTSQIALYQSVTDLINTLKSLL